MTYNVIRFVIVIARIHNRDADSVTPRSRSVRLLYAALRRLSLALFGNRDQSSSFLYTRTCRVKKEKLTVNAFAQDFTAFCIFCTELSIVAFEIPCNFIVSISVSQQDIRIRAPNIAKRLKETKSPEPCSDSSIQFLEISRSARWFCAADPARRDAINYPTHDSRLALPRAQSPRGPRSRSIINRREIGCFVADWLAPGFLPYAHA